MDDNLNDSRDELPAPGEGGQLQPLLDAHDDTHDAIVPSPQAESRLQGGMTIGTHPIAETLIQLDFKLHDHQVFHSSGLKMARTDIAAAYVSIAENSMLAARDRMAKEVQVEPDILPIAVGIGEVYLKVSILLPEGQVDPEKAESLRTLGRLARVSLDGALENLTSAQSGPSMAPRSDASLNGGARASASQSETVLDDSASRVDSGAIKPGSRGGANPFDKVASGLVAALNKKKRPGEITVTVSTGDNDDQGTPFTVAKPDEGDGDHVTFTLQTVPVSLAVGSRISNGLCEVKEAGASSRVRAKFGTSGHLPLQLRLLDGGHPVTALVRRRSGEHAHDARNPAMYIERLLEVDEQWGSDMGGLETFRQVLESLRALLPKVAPEGDPRRGKPRR